MEKLTPRRTATMQPHNQHLVSATRKEPPKKMPVIRGFMRVGWYTYGRKDTRVAYKHLGHNQTLKPPLHSMATLADGCNQE